MKTFKFALAAGALLVSTLAFGQMGFGGPQADMTIDAAQRNQVIDSLVSEMHKTYVFPALAKKVETALVQNRKRGAYDGITSAHALRDKLTADVQAVAKDKHLNVIYQATPIPVRSAPNKPTAEQQAAQLASMRAQNFGVERIERLPFNIGYLDLQGFAMARDAGDTIAATMTVLSNTDALIIDLRENGGGDPATVALLASYFLDKRTHLTDFYYRTGDRNEQMWSSDTVQGKHYGQSKDVYVLTSKFTFSAAEDFSFAMKNQKRVTIVGETTAGGAHPGDFMRLTQHFAMFVPNGRASDPVTKTNWEAVGVTPHVSVPAADAFKTAQLAILKKMADGEKNPGRLERLNARMAAVSKAAAL
jgi:C-terminal processing protease CtpA/Prc